MGTEGDFHRKQGSQACPTGRLAGRWVLGRDRGENGLNPSRPGIKTSKNRQLTGNGWKGGSQAVTCTREGPKVTQGHFLLPLRFLLPLGALSSLLPDKSGSPYISLDTTTSRKPSRTHLLIFPYLGLERPCAPQHTSHASSLTTRPVSSVPALGLPTREPACTPHLLLAPEFVSAPLTQHVLEDRVLPKSVQCKGQKDPRQAHAPPFTSRKGGLATQTP